MAGITGNGIATINPVTFVTRQLGITIQAVCVANSYRGVVGGGTGNGVCVVAGSFSSFVSITTDGSVAITTDGGSLIGIGSSGGGATLKVTVTLHCNTFHCYANALKAASPIFCQILTGNVVCAVTAIITTPTAFSASMSCNANAVGGGFCYVLPFSPPYLSSAIEGMVGSDGIFFSLPPPSDPIYGGVDPNLPDMVGAPPQGGGYGSPPQPRQLIDFLNQDSVLFRVDGLVVDLSYPYFKLLSLAISYDAGKTLSFEEVALFGYGNPTFFLQQKVELFFNWGNGFWKVFTGVIRDMECVGENNKETIRYTAIGYQQVCNDYTVLDPRGIPEVIFASQVNPVTLEVKQLPEGTFNLPFVQFFPITVYEAVIVLFELMGPILAQNGISPYFDTTELSTTTAILPNEVRLTGGFTAALQTLLSYAPGFKLFYNDALQIWQFINVFNRPIMNAVIEANNIANHSVHISTDGRATAVMLVERPEHTAQKQKEHEKQSGDKTPKGNYITSQIMPAWNPILEDDWDESNAIPNTQVLFNDPQTGVPVVVNGVSNPYADVYRAWIICDPDIPSFPSMTAKLIHVKTQELAQLPAQIDIATYINQGIVTKQTNLAEVEAICLPDPDQQLSNDDINALVGTAIATPYNNESAYGVVFATAPVVCEGNPQEPGGAIGPKQGEIALKLEWELTSKPAQQAQYGQLPVWYRWPNYGFAGTAYSIGGLELERRYIVGRDEFTFKSVYLKWLAESSIKITGSLPVVGDPIPEMVFMGLNFVLTSETQTTPFPLQAPAIVIGYTYAFGPVGENQISYTTDVGAFIKQTR